MHKTFKFPISFTIMQLLQYVKFSKWKKKSDIMNYCTCYLFYIRSLLTVCWFFWTLSTWNTSAKEIVEMIKRNLRMYTIAYDSLECNIVLGGKAPWIYTDLNFTFVDAFVTFQRRTWLLFELQNGWWNLWRFHLLKIYDCRFLVYSY